MKKVFTLLLLFIIAVAFIASDRHDYAPNSGIRPPNVYPLAVDSKTLDANTINTWFRNNGSFNRDPLTGNAGFEWPKASNPSKHARYASGLWLGAKVDNDTLIAICEYDYEYLPGYTDANGNPIGKDDPTYKVYKLTRNKNDADRQNWPNALLGNSDQNAPVFFDQSTGTYKPLDLGYNTLYYVYTDSYPEAHANRAGSTKPLKADIQQTNFAFNFGGALGQIAFTQLLVINRSTKIWKDAYLTAWSDDDLGDATDDMVACDTSIGLGYTYNGDNNDGEYGAAPPAVGFDFFRGAIIFTGNNNDTAFICDGNVRKGLAGYRQQGLNVFGWYANGHPTYGDPRAYYETYRQMKGLTRDGAVIMNPVTGAPTTFIYSGDPVNNTGWVSGPMAPDDQRYLQSTGPFDMNPGDTQIIVLGQVIGRGSSNLNSITVLKGIDKKAQQIYDNCFVLPSPPPPPNVTAYAPGNGKIYLTWDDVAERSREFNIYDSAYYNFEGYNVYAIKPGTDGSDENNRTLIATYDVRNGVKDIYDSIEVPRYGAIIYALVQKGSDNGISRTLVLDKDPWSGGNFINGTPYCFSVTAYAYDSASGWHIGTPKVNESSISANVTCVTPQRLAQGTVINYNFGDTIATNRKDLGVLPFVVDPLALQSATYSVINRAYNNRFAWDFVKNGQLITTMYDFSGNPDTALTYDGMMIMHDNIRDSGIVKDFNDPARETRDINSKDYGWDYTPASNVWFRSVDTSRLPTAKLFTSKQFQSRSLNMSHPNTGNYRALRTKVIANGNYFTPVNNILNGGPLRKIRINFGPTQKAFRYAPPDTSTLTSTPFIDLVDIPFQVFEIDDLDSTADPRQLNVLFIDYDNDGQWNPDASTFGNYQIIYIMASSYDPNPSHIYTTRNPGAASPTIGFSSLDIMYAWVPRKALDAGGNPKSWASGDQLVVHPYIINRVEFVPGFAIHYDWAVNGSQINNNGYATANNQMDKVNVFPNPYFGQNRLETNPVNRFVTFTNLPSQCTIYIYSLNGLLIKKLERNNTDPKNSQERWDIKNDKDIPVASGMYIAVIDAPGIGTKIIKMAIFTPEERIDTF